MRRVLAGSMLMTTTLALALAGCDDERSVRLDVGHDDMRFADAQVTYAPDDEFATLSRNGTVKLGLTRERVYFELSDAVREHVDSEIGRNLRDSDSRIARTIGSAVQRGVHSALSVDYALHLENIRDVDYRDGELVFDFVDPRKADALDDVELDGEPITRAFAASDARAFVDAFRRVKRGEPAAPVSDSAASSP